MALSAKKAIRNGKDAAESKALILRAALEEFAQEGFAGARTEHIAKAAGVNIALLFYYFKNKEQLYGAVLESNYAEWNRRMMEALELEASPKEKIRAYAATYFDFASETPSRPRLTLQEMMRAGRTGSPHIVKLKRKYIKPVHERIKRTMREGVAAGEFRAMDAEHFIYSVFGIINMYFACAQAIKVVSGNEPLDPKVIAQRRGEVMRFITQALFAK